MNRFRLSSVVSVCALLSLIILGTGCPTDGPGPGTSGAFTRTRLIKITDTSSPISRLYQSKSTGQTAATFGTKDSSGNLTRVAGTCYAVSSGKYATVYVDEDGHPGKVVSQEGWTISYSNYSSSEVDVGLESPSGQKYTTTRQSLPNLKSAEGGKSARNEAKYAYELGKTVGCTYPDAFDDIGMAPPISALNSMGCGSGFLDDLDEISDEASSVIDDETDEESLNDAQDLLNSGDDIIQGIEAGTTEANEGSLVGSWYVTEELNTGWYMLTDLSSDDTFTYTEYQSYGGGSTGSGVWAFDAEDSYFEWTVYEGTNFKQYGGISGYITGDLDDFNVDGWWSNGTSASFHWTRND